MTISGQVTSISYAGTGTVGPFNITTLEIGAAEEISLSKFVDATSVETPLVISVDYTVSADLQDVTLVVALAVGETLVIDINPPLTQLADYLRNSTFPSEVNEDALDKLTNICKNLRVNSDRSIKVQGTTTLTPPIQIVGDPADNQTIVWDGVNNNFVWEDVVNVAFVKSLSLKVTPSKVASTNFAL